MLGTGIGLIAVSIPLWLYVHGHNTSEAYDVLPAFFTACALDIVGVALVVLGVWRA